MANVTFAEVIERVKCKVDKDNTELLYYVGGEHIMTDEVSITDKGLIKGSTIGPAFHMAFKAGDVLLMSRNPHLRKAATPNFDGICSDVSYVCRTKDSKTLDQRYLPFVMRTDAFWKYAEEHKKGSTNYFLNWSDFADYEFDLPPLDRQKELAELLWAANDLKESYKKMIVTTDEMLKAKFREMFGECGVRNEEGGVWGRDKLSNLLLIERGGSPRPISRFVTDDLNGINWIKIGDVAVGDKYITKTSERIIPAGEKMSRRVYPGDFLLSNSMSFGRPYILKIEGCIHDGWLVLRDVNKIFNSEYLYYLLGSEDAKHFFETQASGSTVKNLNKDLVGAYVVSVPPLVLQQQFVEIARKADETKAALKKSIADVEQVIKGLING